MIVVDIWLPHAQCLIWATHQLLPVGDSDKGALRLMSNSNKRIIHLLATNSQFSSLTANR